MIEEHNEKNLAVAVIAIVIFVVIAMAIYIYLRPNLITDILR